MKNLKQILQTKEYVTGLEVDQDRRWNVVIRLNQINAEGAEQLRLQELQRDSSETGMKMALAGQVIQPNLQIKKDWFDKITSIESINLPLARLKSAMTHLFPLDQKVLQEPFSETFFNRLTRLVTIQKPEYLSIFSENLVPTYCTQESVNQLNQYIKTNPTLPPVVIKVLRVAKQEDERCVAIRRFSND